MAQTSTTILSNKSHKADVTGTDISIVRVSGVSKITSTSTALNNFAVRDLITVTGTTNNNTTFTVKEVTDANNLVVEETVSIDDESDGSTTTTLNHTGFVSDKFKGDGYYSQPDGVHTVAYHIDSTVNDDANISIKMQASLATTPTEDDWFDVSGTSIGQDDIDGSTLVFSSNFTGNFVWVRAKISGLSAGGVDKILYNH